MSKRAPSVMPVEKNYCVKKSRFYPRFCIDGQYLLENEKNTHRNERPGRKHTSLVQNGTREKGNTSPKLL